MSITQISSNLSISIPGFKGKDLKVYALGDSLIIKGDIADEHSSNRSDSTKESRSPFYRWPASPCAHMKSVTAEFKQDALTVRIPVEIQSAAASNVA